MPGEDQPMDGPSVQNVGCGAWGVGLRVADLYIENFRGIKTAKIRFGRHSVLVGPNNCGKTTIIEALALLFGRDRLIRTLTEHDFFGGDPQPADRLRLLATIVDFIPNDEQFHSDWFRENRAVPKWFDEKSGHIHPTRDESTWKLACQVAFCARFDRPTLEVDTLRYFHDDDMATDPFADDSTPTTFPSQLVRDIGFFLVPASRTWDRIISFGSELFKRVVSSIDGKPAESVLVERDRLRVPDKPLEDDPHLENIVKNLNEELSGFFLNEPKLRLRITTTDSEGVLSAVVPHYADSAASPALPAHRQGSGLVSLQGLLLLLQFGRKRAEENQNFWMALEEPELHVPPPLQRRLVRRLQALSSQTFVSTHSPMVAAMSDPETVCVLRSSGGVLSAVPLQPGPLPADTPNSIRSLFQLRRIDTISALMHDVVLIPEGRTDYDWLELLVRAVDVGQGWKSDAESNFGAYIGVVPTQDAAVVNTFEFLSPLHPMVVALVDGDAAGTAYADALANLERPPSAVLRWPDGWMLEDVVGSILSVDESGGIAALAALPQPPSSIAELVARLKTNERNVHGLKHDQVAYEVVAAAIAALPECRKRARDILNALTDAALGRQVPMFVADPCSPIIRTFSP
jgi:energy-coupling factor transporter ATP-binding protein EcfA2